ncbi:MAG: phosphatase PAP2 family protein [Gemmatimonadota bacterium]
MNGTSGHRVPERRSWARRAPFRWPLDALYRTIRWVGHHSHGFYTAVGGFLLIGLGIALGTLGLVALLSNVVAAGVIQGMDEAVVLAARDMESPVLDALALVGAVLGSGTAAWVVMGAGTFFLWRSRHHYSVYLLWASLGGARLLNIPLKDWFGRPRPEFFRGEIDLLGRSFTFPESYSFPSGHALTSTVIFFTLAYLVARLEKTPTMRKDTFVAAAVVVLLVSLSRIYIGVHFPSDVIAGILVGFMWATTAALGIEVIRYFRTRKPDVVEEEKDIEKGIRPLQETVHG